MEEELQVTGQAGFGKEGAAPRRPSIWESLLLQMDFSCIKKQGQIFQPHYYVPSMHARILHRTGCRGAVCATSGLCGLLWRKVETILSTYGVRRFTLMQSCRGLAMTDWQL